MNVHPTAIVEDGARLGADVRIGPYCVIGRLVRLGDGCHLHAHVSIQGDTHLGPGNEIWPFASLGGIAQDRKVDRDAPSGTIRIGARNLVRENVTVHPGTPLGGGTTVIGDDNMLQIGAHLGHDTSIGNHVVMTGGAMVAGHTSIGDRAVLGAMVGVHQFCRIGRLAMLGAGSMVPKDAPPFAMVQGDRARIRGVNVIGMRRAGYSAEDVAVVKRTYRALFWRTDVLHARVEKVRASWGDHPLVAEILDFMSQTRRGVLMSRGRTELAEERETELPHD
jgi:UDP-N-acetylglucosamine acyltransferase